jgi:hypothetical protein
MTEEKNETLVCPISTKADTIFSVILLPLTILALGFAYYLFYKQLTDIPFILLAALLFGFSCMGLIRMWKLHRLGKACH